MADTLLALAETDVREPIPAAALLAALQTPPFVLVPGTFNTRDLGLLSVLGEGRGAAAEGIRPGFIFRSGGLEAIGRSTDGQAVLRDGLRVRRVFDLRSREEHARAADPAVRAAFWVAGRDRTGVLAGLLETLAGYDADTVRADFLLSRIGTEVAREHLLGFARKYSKGSAGDGDGSASFGEVPGFLNLVSLRGVCWDAFVEAVGEKFGGFEGYVTKVLGLSAEDLVVIKKNLTKAP